MMLRVEDIKVGQMLYQKSAKTITKDKLSPKIKMVVTYINKEHFYYIAEYEINGTKIKEAFKLCKQISHIKPLVTEEERRAFKAADESLPRLLNKPVICLDDGKIYATAREAEEAVGIRGVRGCCCGGRKSAEGTHWAWLYDYEKRLKKNPNAREEMLAEKEPKINIRGGAAKKIVCVETGQVFNSITEASKLFNTSSFNISHALTGDNKTAGGYQWQYLEDYQNKPLKPLNKMLWGKKWARPVICLETKEVFETSYKAAETYGLNKSTVSNCVNGRANAAGGKHWMYYDIYKKRYEE